MIGSLAYILADLSRGTSPKGEKMAAACRRVDSQDPATILDPFRTIFANLGPRQISAVETGQMSAVETRQMSSAETRQMSTGKTGRCPILLFYICLVSAEDICLVSTADICPVPCVVCESRHHVIPPIYAMGIRLSNLAG